MLSVVVVANRVTVPKAATTTRVANAKCRCYPRLILRIEVREMKKKPASCVDYRSRYDTLLSEILARNDTSQPFGCNPKNLFSQCKYCLVSGYWKAKDNWQAHEHSATCLVLRFMVESQTSPTDYEQAYRSLRSRFIGGQAGFYSCLITGDSPEDRSYTCRFCFHSHTTPFQKAHYPTCLIVRTTSKEL